MKVLNLYAGIGEIENYGEKITKLHLLNCVLK